MTIYNIKDQVKGDTFSGLAFEVLVNDAAKDLTNTAIAIEFRYGDKKGDLGLSLSVGSGIIITAALEGKFMLDAFIVDLEPGLYYYDVQFTDGSVVKTYVEGTMKVIQDVTQ